MASVGGDELGEDLPIGFCSDLRCQPSAQGAIGCGKVIELKN